MRKGLGKWILASLAMLGFLLATIDYRADGTETLGSPEVAILTGTAVVGDGTGLHDNQPAVVSFEIPDGAAVSQVLLYWNGFHTCALGAQSVPIRNREAAPGDPRGSRFDTVRARRKSVGSRGQQFAKLRSPSEVCIGGDDSLMLRAGGAGGFQPVVGTLIGGPTQFFGSTWSSTYRADISSLGLVGVGENLIEIQGADFDKANNGASIIAIYDDGSVAHDIQLRDGQDLAFRGFAGLLRDTVEQTFFFTASPNARTAELTLVAGSVQGPVSGSDPVRPSLVKITVNPGAISDDRSNLLESNQGDEWDHHVIQVAIPPGATSLTVQVLSEDPLLTGLNPASLGWLASALSLPPENDCNLKVQKTCSVPGGPPSGNDCRGKIISMKLQYTAGGCGATTNTQGGAVECVGGTTPADDPVDVFVEDKRSEYVYADEIDVPIGGVVEVLASNALEPQLKNEIRIVIGNNVETIRLHTSCSQPIRVGDHFGSMRVIELTTTHGGTVTLDQPAGSSECLLPPLPPGPHCDGGLKTLTLRYEGGGCDESTNLQEGALVCAGDAQAFEPVRIVGWKDGDVFLDSGDPAGVFLGDLALIDAANAAKDDLPSNTRVGIYDDLGGEIQTLTIHTSCSKEVNLGDRFGALEVFAMTLKDGTSVSQASTVNYSYAVTNNSPGAVINVTVVDDKLGIVPGSPIPVIGAGETVELQASAEIGETTRNVVTVNGTLDTGETCRSVRDSARVRVKLPPLPPDICFRDGDDDDDDDDGIEAMELEYIGPTIVDPVTVVLLADAFRNEPVNYSFPGGLPTGTVVASPVEGDFTVDAELHGEEELGSKTRISINGVEEVLHTSCSTPFVLGEPAPLDRPKGAPSMNWFVVRFRD